jgi:hypothetical protein
MKRVSWGRRSWDRRCNKRLYSILFARASRADYNRFYMDALMHLLAPVLEAMFFIGMAGSALVIVISAVEDVVTILEKD